MESCFLTGNKDMKNFVKKSVEERKKEVAELTEKLETGVKAIFEDGNFTDYLKTMAKFHRYSVNNQILIWCQCPTATMVAGFNDWKKKFHRTVKKGEKGIRIFAPMPVKIKPEAEESMLPNGVMDLSEEDEKVITLFRTVAVFDILQTEGKPLPEFELPELAGKVRNYENMLDAIISVSPCDVSFEKIDNGAKGYYSVLSDRIVVNAGMSEEQTIKTCLHEIAHAILHNREKQKKENKDRPTKEVEAESTAYVVANALGFNTETYSFGYVASWSCNKAIPELKSSLEVIRNTATELIDSIEKVLDGVAWLNSKGGSTPAVCGERKRMAALPAQMDTYADMFGDEYIAKTVDAGYAECVTDSDMLSMKGGYHENVGIY